MCFSLWLLSKSSNITRSFHRILYETISWHTWASRLHKRKIPKNQYPFEKKMMLSLTPCGIWQPGIHTNLIRLLKVQDSFFHLTLFHITLFKSFEILRIENEKRFLQIDVICLRKNRTGFGQENRKICLPKINLKKPY